MEFYQIKYFIVLAEELHFKKAADRLYIVQPALSRQIAALEKELGFKLFERDKRNVHLTPAGISFWREVSGVFDMLEKAKRNALYLHQNTNNVLEIGYVGSALNGVLPAFIEELQKKISNIKTHLIEMTTAQQMVALKEGKLDIGFSRNPEEHKLLQYKVIQKETFSLVFPSSHKLSKKKTLDLGQIKDQPFILPSRSDGDEYYHLIMELFKEAGFEPSVIHESVHGHTILKLIENGLGISILPTSFNTMKNTKVTFIELKNYKPRAELFAVWNKENRNPALNRAIDLITKNMSVKL